MRKYPLDLASHKPVFLIRVYGGMEGSERVWTEKLLLSGKRDTMRGGNY